jgi:hypothetical protein
MVWELTGQWTKTESLKGLVEAALKLTRRNQASEVYTTNCYKDQLNFGKPG